MPLQSAGPAMRANTRLLSSTKRKATSVFAVLSLKERKTPMFQTPSAVDQVPRKYRLLGLLLTCLLASTILFSFGARTAHAYTNPAVAFANAHWNCWTAACTSRVHAGAAQPYYQCAEFVARSLAYEGFIPGLSSTSSQRAYEYYRPGNGVTYDLLLITPYSGYHTLANFLLTYGYFVNIGKNLGNTQPGDMVVYKDRYGTPQHIGLVIRHGTSTSNTMLDFHNSARYNVSLSSELGGEFTSWYVLHIHPYP